MANRDWDKLRRQARASIPVFFTAPARHRAAPVPVRSAPIDRKHLPPAHRLLRIHTPEYSADVLFSRIKGTWRVAHAPAQVDWMNRVKHPEVIYDWLLPAGKSRKYRRPPSHLYGQARSKPAIPHPPLECPQPGNASTPDPQA